MVSVSVAAAERLHVIAHRAVLAARDADDWWTTPMETAFATVDLARHTHVHWIDAAGALDRLLRWWHEDGPRRTSADVTAMALLARAAAELQRQDVSLTMAAAEGLEDLARRDPSIVPMLHLALSAWALDPLLPDRETIPWPALRARVTPANQMGVNEPLRLFTASISQRPFDSAWLVQGLVTQVGSAAGSSDACILVWLITVACERITLSLPAEDSALQVLLRRRSELTERLTGEIDEETFRDPEPAIFEEDSIDIASPARTYLSSFEAILLDFSLASRDVGEPWLTHQEAEKLFGERAAAARKELSVTRYRLLRIIEVLTASFGLASSTALWLALRSAGVDRAVANPSAVALAALLFMIAARVARTDAHASLTEPVGIFFASLMLLAAAVAVDEASPRPYIGDVGGLIAGTLIAAGAAVLWALLRRREGPNGD